MNTPNPLIPQGSLLQPGTKTKSKIGLVVFGVIAIHAVFFLGLLVQGCKREEAKAKPQPTLPPPAVDPYYTKYSELTNPTPTPSNQVPPAPATNVPAPAPTTVAAPEPAAPTAMPTPVTPEAADSATREYTIQKGDSFYSIGKKQGVPMSAIAKANPGVDPARLKVGQKIKLPASGAAAATPAPATAAAPEAASGFTTYTVKTGDTLTKIARNHHTTVAALRSANNLKTDRIPVGKKLKVPAAKTAEAPAAPAAPTAEAPAAIPAPGSMATAPATTSAPPASAIPRP